MQAEEIRNTYGAPVIVPVKTKYLLMMPSGEVVSFEGTGPDREQKMAALGLDLENGRWAFAQQHSYHLYWQVCGSDGEMQAAMRTHLREQVKARPCDIR